MPMRIRSSPAKGRCAHALCSSGEQPGDREDKRGHPFVAPAGRIFDQAIADGGLDRSEGFVTNAVKQFKHEMRGKQRLRKRPNT
jgi:uracil-DNA glycosylase family 4